MNTLKKHMIIKQLALLVIAVFFLSGCKSTKTEQQQYAQLQSSFSYGTYSGLSDTGVETIAYGYNRINKDQLEDLGAIDPTLTHAMMSYFFSLGVSQDFAIAESDLALAKAHDLRSQYLAFSAQSLAFYNKGWRKMAKQKADFIRTDPVFRNVSQSYPKEQLVSYLILGSVAIREGDLHTTQNMFQVIAEQTQKPWLPSLAKAVSVILNGSMIDAVVMLKDISTDPTLNQYERDKIAEVIGIASSDLKVSRKKQQITQLTDDFFLDRIKDKSTKVYRNLISELQNYTKQIL